MLCLPSVSTNVPVVNCMRLIPVQLCLFLLVQSCVAGNQIADDHCIDWVELCHSCEPVNSDSQIVKWDEHHGISSTLGCVAKCTMARSCAGFAWNPETKQCTTLSAGHTKTTDVSPRHLHTSIYRCNYCSAAAVDPAAQKDGVWTLKWSKSLLSSEFVELAVIYAGSKPNEQPFRSASNSEFIMGDAKLVVPNNGSFVWKLPGHVSGNGFFHIRSLPYRELKGQCGSDPVRLFSSQCVMDKSKRSDCGFPGIGNKQCHDKGCCYDNFHSDTANCFLPVPNDQVILTVWWRFCNEWVTQIPQIVESTLAAVLRW
eukprot:CAMPEP_0184303708 /NCGR_PEP_ID=MMETSP1049-20130417/13405_1 /TAXON_ID=77928 /ORGANISM="Proteomonas sulcata, Strain CCMP704" /LENGTH=312 /DNA_ID=CAMNT_0026615335 /DNA_START=200 /DNA_END=1135 /DNA_ORIENTATION=+